MVTGAWGGNEENSGDDGTVLGLDCDGGYMTIHSYQNPRHYKLNGWTVCKLFLNVKTKNLRQVGVITFFFKKGIYISDYKSTTGSL